jgi:eukaryotic-like serine/threonine-protein kinase
MAQQRDGDAQSARKTLAAAVASFDWHLSEADSRDIWMYHILRREAEAAIFLNAPTSSSDLQPARAPLEGD